MASQHPPRFLKLVNDSKQRVRETTVDDVKARMDRRDNFILIDVREDREFDKDHLPGAIHLGKGIIERDIEGKYPDVHTPMVLYCGGGFRSALAANRAQFFRDVPAGPFYGFNRPGAVAALAALLVSRRWMTTSPVRVITSVGSECSRSSL